MGLHFSIPPSPLVQVLVVSNSYLSFTDGCITLMTVYNRWTGLVDWTSGLDYWTEDFHLKCTFRGSIMRCNGGK